MSLDEHVPEIEFGDDGKPLPPRQDPKKPPPYKPRVDAWESEAKPMPGWCRRYMATGVLPSRAEREAPPEPELPSERAAREARDAYGRAWRACEREMVRAKGEAAMLVRVHGAESEIGRAARQRGFDVDEEWARLVRLRNKGAPLAVPSFPPLDGSDAGKSLAAAERARSRAPLFDPARAAANDLPDPLEFP